MIGECPEHICSSPVVTCGESLPSPEDWNLVQFLLCELPETALSPTESVRKDSWSVHHVTVM